MSKVRLYFLNVKDFLHWDYGLGQSDNVTNFLILEKNAYSVLRILRLWKNEYKKTDLYLDWLMYFVLYSGTNVAVDAGTAGTRSGTPS